MTASPPRAWAEIDLDALRHNLRVARDTSGQEVMAVVKAGAYGHGLEEIATALEGEDIAMFGVANVGEARRLTLAGISTPIYLLGPCFDGERAEVVANAWIPSLSSHHEADQFHALAHRSGKILEVHLTVDTGMGRGGFLPDQVPAALTHIATLPALRLTGIGSHLPAADEDPAFTRAQFDAFDTLVEQITSGLPNPTSNFQVHLANSAGLIGYASRTTNLVRPGLMLYGCSPIPGFQDQLRAVMTLRSRVSIVRDLPAGHGISYGRTTILARPSRIATVGIGYGDGYPRALSGQNTDVLIRGRRCPVLGRVTMDQIMVDVTDLPACTTGDEVELFGPEIPVAEIAAKAGTIPWEILTGITSRVTRTHLHPEPSDTP